MSYRKRSAKPVGRDAGVEITEVCVTLARGQVFAPMIHRFNGSPEDMSISARCF